MKLDEVATEVARAYEDVDLTEAREVLKDYEFYFIEMAARTPPATLEHMARTLYALLPRFLLIRRRKAG